MPAAKRKAQLIAKSEPDAVDVDLVEQHALTNDAAKRRKIDEKEVKLDYSDRSRFQESRKAEEYGIVPRKFYPPVMSLERAKKYATGEIERPITSLRNAITNTRTRRENIAVGEAVVHWYKCDLRINDNTALHLAAEKAKSKNVPLICMYLISPQDFEAHFTAAVRVDFILRNLESLKNSLVDLDVPLYVETIEKRKTLPERVVQLCKEWKAKHLFSNMEYEVDELRRDAKLTQMCLDQEINFTVVEDTCVVPAGVLTTAAGGQMSVYSPWHRKWCKYIADHPDVLKEQTAPGQNPSSARQKFAPLFDVPIPSAPENKALSKDDQIKYAQLWPVGETEAHNRLHKFIKERVSNYHNARNFPAGDHTSTLSPHLAAGTLAARTAVRECLKDAGRKAPTDDRSNGHMLWIGEVAWRDFYKHVLCNWPYVCMNVPFKPEYNNIEWEYNDEQFKAWTEGKTGYPIVDAVMRQCNETAYAHNRTRMVTASFLAKDLMIDWRMGERYFMEHLVDGDFASNNGGWGFSASCGVDPQPYFRIFNPLLQSEKFDESGDYIRRWVPELRDVKGKAIHDPYGRGADAIAKKNGYPKPIVVHKESRDRALARYKAGIGRTTA